MGSLATMVDTAGPLAFVDVLGLGADIAEALDEVHGGGQAHGAVHVRAVVRGGGGPWILAAPGLAAGGSPALAPELADGGPPTPAGDVFALGAILVFALTGQQFVEGALGADDAAPAPAGDAEIGAADAPSGPRSLPDVMALFLDTLRRTLATDPATRGSAALLAGTLRQLRTDAERAIASPVVVGSGTTATGAMAAVGATRAVNSGYASAPPPPGAIVVDGTTRASGGGGSSARLPLVVAAAAVFLAVVMVVMLSRKEDRSEDRTATALTTTTDFTVPTTPLPPVTVIVVATEPPTTAVSTTTTKPTTTTAPPSTEPPPVTVPETLPPTTAPPVTLVPPGYTAVIVDMSHMTSCGGCAATIRKEPKKTAGIVAQVPDKTVLWGQCVTSGDSMHDDQGFTSDKWVFVAGPVGQGWVPITFTGRKDYGVPACPPSTSTTTAAR